MDRQMVKRCCELNKRRHEIVKDFLMEVVTKLTEDLEHQESILEDAKVSNELKQSLPHLILNDAKKAEKEAIKGMLNTVKLLDINIEDENTMIKEFEG